MDIGRDVEHLKRHLSLHLHQLLAPARCRQIITRYDAAQASGQLQAVKPALIAACRELVFTGDIHTLLGRYFQGPFAVRWPSFDVVDSAGPAHNRNALWHVDHGIRGTHKLFIYLNAVADHGGNTVMVDQARTIRLRQADALPVEQDQRTADLSAVCAALGISQALLAYDLEAGDGLLFDPLRLAHRCQPTLPGMRRYTVCFTLMPQQGAAPAGQAGLHA